MKLTHLAPLAACAAALAFAPLPASAEPVLAAGVFQTPENPEAGTADLSEGPQGVVIRVNIEGIEPGWHAIHFHETGTCADEGYKESGSHVHHSGKKPHGLLNPEGPDDGDLPNIYADANGVVNAEIYSDRVTLAGAEGRANLLDEDGAALVIHEAADDHMSQPIGGAGARIACAVINKVE
jgi:Cu-Zn family superoxide dismutase